MALVICPQCSGIVADNAPYCPHCGAPQRVQPQPAPFVKQLKEFTGQHSTQTNLPLLGGAAVGVGVVLAGHFLLGGADGDINVRMLWWQVALGALLGCLTGALLQRK
ncbi:MAG TPA: hypothetical protein VNK04_02890 [Gemmataceae bacterium]|nr:hypothetical protein [Gemmataceae bacterium]